MTPFLALLAVQSADPPPSPLAQLQCPADPAVICQAEAGPNHAFLYAYPAEIRAITMLNASFRRSQSQAWERFQALIAEARHNPQAIYYREEVYTIDADRPELLALAVRQVQRAGGDEARWTRRQPDLGPARRPAADLRGAVRGGRSGPGAGQRGVLPGAAPGARRGARPGRA